MSSDPWGLSLLEDSQMKVSEILTEQQQNKVTGDKRINSEANKRRYRKTRVVLHQFQYLRIQFSASSTLSGRGLLTGSGRARARPAASRAEVPKMEGVWQGFGCVAGL